MTPAVIGEDAHVFKPRDAVAWKNDFRERTEVPGEKFWEGEIAPRGTFQDTLLDMLAVISPSRDVSLVPGTAALANAVFDAVGRRLTTIPLTRERVRAALA